MAPVDPHLFHPEQLRTAERVARLDPPRAYWAGCALCGTSVDLAAPARRRRPDEPSRPASAMTLPPPVEELGRHVRPKAERS